MTEIMKFRDATSKAKCPYCGQELDDIERIRSEGPMIQPTIFTLICPKCKKILGFS